MWKTVVMAVILVLALFGLTELLHILYAAWLRPRSVRTVTAVLLSGRDATAQLHYAGCQMHWYGRHAGEYRLGIPLDASAEALCRAEGGRYDMLCCPPGQLCAWIEKH